MGDPTRRGEQQVRAAFEKAREEAADLLTRLEEEVVRALPSAETPPPPAPSEGRARPVLPKLDPRLLEGSADERAEVFLELVEQLDQPWTIEQAMLLTQLEQRTVERHIAKGMDWGRLERVSKGLYRLVPTPSKNG